MHDQADVTSTTATSSCALLRAIQSQPRALLGAGQDEPDRLREPRQGGQRLDAAALVEHRGQDGAAHRHIRHGAAQPAQEGLAVPALEPQLAVAREIEQGDAILRGRNLPRDRRRPGARLEP
jgi:hypothetical protein